MESQTNEAYQDVLQLLRELIGNKEIITERVITDFEQAQFNGWSETFQCRMQGCLWHEVRVRQSI